MLKNKKNGCNKFIVDRMIPDAYILQQVLKNPIQSISVHESHLFNEIRLIGKNIKGMFIYIEPYEII